MLPIRTDEQRTTSKHRATQLLICEPLSFAIQIFNRYHHSPGSHQSSQLTISQWVSEWRLSLPEGHSCNNGNAPNFVEIFLKTVICVFWMNIWYGITFTKTEKVMGKLKKDFFIYIWQNVWFFCPEETLTIFCKIKCQSFNFICQALEKSLKFAYQSYRLKEYICFRIFLKMRFFWPICELVMFFKSS